MYNHFFFSFCIFKFVVFILIVFNIVNLGLYLVVFLKFNSSCLFLLVLNILITIEGHQFISVYCHVLPSLNKVTTYLPTKSQSSLSILTSISGDSDAVSNYSLPLRLEYLFTPGCKIHQSVVQMCDTPLSRQARQSLALLQKSPLNHLS